MTTYLQAFAATGVFLLMCSAGPPAKAAPNMPHISGGVGLEARDELRAKEADYNLKITTAARSGAYLAGVRVIVEAPGGARLLNTEMRGPLLLVRLPPGSYTIRATLEGDTLTRAVVIPAQGRLDTMFQWEVSD
jgi:hypothetical protein